MAHFPFTNMGMGGATVGGVIYCTVHSNNNSIIVSDCINVKILDLSVYNIYFCNKQN